VRANRASSSQWFPSPSRGGIRWNQQRARVSCLTAAGVLSALDRDRFDVVGVGITRTGRWIVVDPDTISRCRDRRHIAGTQRNRG
jgi:D-alanine-D-alanine ligase-like ATP-grasp enzyme